MGIIEQAIALIPESEHDGKFCILAVDDSRQSLDALHRITEIADPNIRFCSFTEINEAFQSIPTIGPNLICTDLSMNEGESSGLLFAEKIKKAHPDTPIALVTAGNITFSLSDLQRDGKNIVDFVVPKEDFTVDRVLSIKGKVERMEKLIRQQR